MCTASGLGVSSGVHELRILTGSGNGFTSEKRESRPRTEQGKENCTG